LCEVGENVKNFVEGITDQPINTSADTGQIGNAYLNLGVGLTGKKPYEKYSWSIFGFTFTFDDYNSRDYYYAGRNYRYLAKGLTGLEINDSRYYYYNNAGKNVNTVARRLTGDTSSTASKLAMSSTSDYDSKVFQFKQRADQTFYDMYINPNGIKKAFTNLSTTIQTKIAGLTPIDTRTSANVGGPTSGSVIGIGKTNYWENKDCAWKIFGKCGNWNTYYYSYCSIKPLKGYSVSRSRTTVYVKDPTGKLIAKFVGASRTSSVKPGCRVAYIDPQYQVLQQDTWGATIVKK
jgi:hypothetical protein